MQSRELEKSRALDPGENWPGEDGQEKPERAQQDTAARDRRARAPPLPIPANVRDELRIRLLPKRRRRIDRVPRSRPEPIERWALSRRGSRGAESTPVRGAPSRQAPAAVFRARSSRSAPQLVAPQRGSATRPGNARPPPPFTISQAGSIPQTRSTSRVLHGGNLSGARRRAAATARDPGVEYRGRSIPYPHGDRDCVRARFGGGAGSSRRAATTSSPS